MRASKKKFLLHLSGILLSALLFSLSHPNVFFSDGLGFLAYFALVPLFFCLKRLRLNFAWIWGAFYGVASYALLCFWVLRYSSLALFSGLFGYMLIFALVFEAMAISSWLFKKNSQYVMALLWCVYEYLKTLGFLGFSYGILGYTQWRCIPLLQCTSVFGVWALSAFCVFASAILTSLLESFCAHATISAAVRVFKALKQVCVPLAVWVFAFFIALLYGFFALHHTEECREVSVLCVQTNIDSLQRGISVYRKNVDKLLFLTEQGLLEHKEADFVIWPESAVVPPIELNFYKNDGSDRFNLASDVLSFMQNKDACFVIGNQVSELGADGSVLDYNSALLFDRRLNNILPPTPEHYAKIHLVPFAEYFPYKKALPHVYNLLSKAQGGLWNKGTAPSVFFARGLSFSVPICFEDTFGSLCALFVKNGAACLFNMSNDSWSKSIVCQKQHLSMAVFRAVENHVPLARSTTTGETCFVDFNGRISAACKSFSATTLFYTMHIPLQKTLTLYTRWGDWFPRLELIFILLLFVWQIYHLKVNRKSDSIVL